MTLEAGRVVVTGSAWMGAGIGSIQTALRELFDHAEDEIALTAYAVSSSRDFIFDLLSNVLARGVRVTMVVNRLSGQPVSVAHKLRRLAGQFQHFQLRDYRNSDERTDLHAKAVVADRNIAIVGSSNISSRGWITNHELAVIVRGAAARQVAKAIDRLLANRWCIRIT